MKIALITGITGQDGSYLAEFLLQKDYMVYGLLRRGSTDTTERISHLLQGSFKKEKRCEGDFEVLYGDVTDSLNIVRVIDKIKPDEIYNLAAQSHVAVSFEEPEYTANADGLGMLRILEAVRILNLTDKTKIYQASTSELYGKVEEIPQTETTPFHPRSPYAVAKMYAFWMAKHYRETYEMFVSNGILFNHESERRGETFVTRKITIAAAKISAGLQDKLFLGNLDAKRDWGYAPDYVECMWMILQQDKPDDFVIATGETRTVREFCTLAFHYAGIDLEWCGEGIEEKGSDKNTKKVIVEVSPEFFRPAEVDLLLGCPDKAIETLGWNPRKTSFEALVQKMMEHDLNKIKFSNWR